MGQRTKYSRAQTRQRYSHIAGFRGVVATPRGLGARFVASKLQEARTSAGLEPGDVFTVFGIPLEVAESEMESILTDLNWPAKVIDNSRRVRGRTDTLESEQRILLPRTSLSLLQARRW